MSHGQVWDLPAVFAEQRLLHIQDLARLHYNSEEDEKETSPNELISGWGTTFTAHTDHSIQTEKYSSSFKSSSTTIHG